jgi:curli production assembly/transport component CsgF
MKLFLLAGLLLAGAARPALAQRFVYTPVNPAFGGNTFNYSWLQASATAQNTTVDPASYNSTAVNPLTQFSNNLNQQVLAQLTNRLLASQFGQGAIKEGSYTVGAYQVVVAPGSGGVVVTVTDTGTGNKTTITIPNGL